LGSFYDTAEICKELEQRNVCDSFIEFCSKLAKVYDKHTFQFQNIYSFD